MCNPSARACGGVVVEDAVARVLGVRGAVVNDGTDVVAVPQLDAVRIELVVRHAETFSECMFIVVGESGGFLGALQRAGHTFRTRRLAFR